MPKKVLKQELILLQIVKNDPLYYKMQIKSSRSIVIVFSINFAVSTAITLNNGGNEQYEIILHHLYILLTSTLPLEAVQ